MAVHDDYARVTPYELLFPAPEFPDERFPAVQAEADARGTDLANPAAFAMSGAVQGILADLRSEDETADERPGAADRTAQPSERVHEIAQTSARDPQTAHGHALLLYFAFHLWRLESERPDRSERPDPSECPDPKEAPRPQARPAWPPLALIRRSTLRTLLAGEPPTPGWETALRGRAGYLQLPQHLAWVEEPGAERPESVDGFFWTATRTDAFHAAAITGVRPGRPGYGVVPVPPEPLQSLSSWTAGPGREGGDDFATDLPGAEIDGLLGIRTPAEVFKLLALALERWTEAAQTSADRPASSRSPRLVVPTPASAAAPNERPPGSTAGSPAPSRLPHWVL